MLRRQSRLACQPAAQVRLVLVLQAGPNVYVNDAGKIKFPLENLGWKKVDEAGHEVPPGKNSYRVKTPVGKVFSNMEFDIWEDSRSIRWAAAWHCLRRFGWGSMSPFSTLHRGWVTALSTARILRSTRGPSGDACQMATSSTATRARAHHSMSTGSQ